MAPALPRRVASDRIGMTGWFSLSPIPPSDSCILTLAAPILFQVKFASNIERNMLCALIAVLEHRALLE